MTAPGWHQDNTNPGQERYWDGQQWTDQTRPVGGPPPQHQGYPAGPPVVAQRSWFSRHKILTGVMAFILFVIVVSAVSNSGKKANTAVTDPLTHPTSAPVATQPAATHPPVATRPAAPQQPNDKGWVVQSLNTRDDGVGDFGGTARITNTNDTSQTATFTFTLARGGQQIASMQGSADGVAPGKTVTVQLIGQDKYSPGPFTYDFQTDTSY